VSPTCPRGHASATSDYCDQCGAPIGRAAPVTAPDARPDTTPSHVTSPSPVSEPCPQCGAPRGGQDRFCESCGFDFGSDVPAGGDAVAPSWAVTIAPDREYFERVAPEGVSFPDNEAAQTIALDAANVRIGRRRPTGGDNAPEIELGDPAVSRLHATLVRAPDGSWAIVDAGSSNGTTINDGGKPIPPHVEVPLHDGDRVHVGAWTTITVALRSRAA
jgi:FHA domain